MESAVRVTGEIQLDRDNPWPGLASYDESSFSFFSGRTAESAELFRRILDEPITVLFGKSGLGKTSLLRAGVFPRVRDRDLLPILIRLQLRAGADPLTTQVQRTLFDELRSQGIEHPGIRDGESLWEYLHRARLEFWTPQNRLVRPVFVSKRA
jgi:Novel STAND NTPase 1